MSLGLTLGDINITGGEAANLTTIIDGLEYEFTIVNMTDGPVTVGLLPGSVEDPTGNVNVIRMFVWFAAMFIGFGTHSPMRSRTAPTPYTMTYDGTPPNVSLYSPLWDPTSADIIPITATFSECVSFELLDVQLSSGFACGMEPLTPCRRNEPFVVLFRVRCELFVRAAPLSPLTQVVGLLLVRCMSCRQVLGMVGGNFTANVTANQVHDVAGNGNVEIGHYAITVDKSRPQVLMTTTTPSPTNGNITVLGPYSPQQCIVCDDRNSHECTHNLCCCSHLRCTGHGLWH